MTFKEVDTQQDYLTAAELFKEYALQLDIDLSFQNFDQELKNIENEYAKPKGTIMIAFSEDNLLGCFAIRPIDPWVCELKRMYLRKQARGLGLGTEMMDRAIAHAKGMGYKKMRLDTLPSMLAAIALYERSGFYEIEPYRFNPVQGTKYFEIDLKA